MTRLILAQNGLIRQRDSRFFFISSHRCPVIFLNSILMVDQIDNYLLLFDSKLYDNQSNTDGVTTSNECFYYEKSTESFYATVLLLLFEFLDCLFIIISNEFIDYFYISSSGLQLMNSLSGIPSISLSSNSSRSQKKM